LIPEQLLSQTYKLPAVEKQSSQISERRNLKELKLSQKRRKYMEIALQVANDVLLHDWDEILLKSDRKVDPCKFDLFIDLLKQTNIST
jgi:hypothetical protein